MPTFLSMIIYISRIWACITTGYCKLLWKFNQKLGIKRKLYNQQIKSLKYQNNTVFSYEWLILKYHFLKNAIQRTILYLYYYSTVKIPDQSRKPFYILFYNTCTGRRGRWSESTNVVRRMTVLTTLIQRVKSTTPTSAIECRIRALCNTYRSKKYPYWGIHELN